ncbi:MAG: glycosyltransferase family 4 protein [Chloroflexi bacterium]|nr:glycosyltransferase family 4 protein [Chloroflexota bacterium]
MRILYVASGIPVPGNYGGSTHTVEVAKGLAELGHKVDVVAYAARGETPRLIRLGPIDVYRYSVPKKGSFGKVFAVDRLVRELKPDVIMERYYNFAGAGMISARRMNRPSVLEINAPVFDPDRSLKSRVDRWLLGGLMRRWGEAQCRWADGIVTPLAGTVPPAVSREKVHEINWGANVELFSPELAAERPGEVERLRDRLGLPQESRVAVFQGSFRRWHGVGEFVEAAATVLRASSDVHLLMIGTGPLFKQIAEAIRREKLEDRLKLVGSVSYAEMPLHLALADVGVAPFNTVVHAPLREVGFYWSPLKIFEYMAMGLPVVTADIEPLNRIIRSGQEGLVFQEGNSRDLAARILDVLGDLPRARQMGQSARERVVQNFSWQVHCQQLEGVIRGVVRK